MKQIDSKQSQQCTHNQAKDAQLNNLISLPTKLLLAVLKSEYKGHSYIKQSTTEKIDCDFIKKGEQNQITALNINKLLVWLHSTLINNKQIAFSTLCSCLQQQDEHLKQMQPYLIEYLCAYLTAECIKDTKMITMIKRLTVQQFWNKLIYKLIKTSIEQQNIQMHTLILEQFMNNLLLFTKESLEQSSPFLFNIFKQVLQLAATYKPGAVQSIRKAYIQQYQLCLLQQARSGKQWRIFEQLKMVELLHIADNTFAISELAKNSNFMYKHLYACLSDFGRKGANALAINIYGAIMKELQLFDSNMQVFVDIYLTLDCYGMHLVKDIWERFYTLCSNAEAQPNTPSHYHIFPISSLLHVILSKVEQHTNHNVPKHCIQSLLAAPPLYTTPIFQHLHDTVYGSLIQILNTGTHYGDITHFHQDSKIYTLVRLFYLGYYNQLISQKQINLNKLKQHLQKLLHAMNKYITFEHCIMAYIGILEQIHIGCDSEGKAIKLLGKEEADILVELTNRFYIRLTYRKRYILLQSVLACLKNSVNLQQIGLKYTLENIIMKLPRQIVEIGSTYDGKTIASCYALIIDHFGNQLDSLSQQLQQRYTNAYIQLTSDKQLAQAEQIQEYKQKLQCNQNIRKEQIIVSIIMQWKDSQQNSIEVRNKLMSQTIQADLQIIAHSSYCHPLLHAVTMFSINMLAKYSSLQSVASIVANNTEVQHNILITITSNSNNKLMSTADVLACLQIVAAGINQSDNQPHCKNYAKFIEYCIAQLNTTSQTQCHYFVSLLIHALKYKYNYTKKYIAIQDSLYSLFDNIKQINHLSPKHKLRLQLILFCILAHDFQYAWQTLNSTKPQFVEEIGQFCNLYDYEHYEEVFNFYVAVAKTMSKAHRKQLLEKQRWDNFASSICKHIQQALKTMLHNLDYGVHRKEVVSTTQCIVKIAIILKFTDQAVNLINCVLEVGERYWGFQRHTIFTLLSQLNDMHYQQQIQMYQAGLLKLIPSFVILEQYRGQDSAILLPEHNHLPIYTLNKLHQQADYDGTAIRFAVIDWAQNQLNRMLQLSQKQLVQHTTRVNIQFWLQLFNNCFDICMTQNIRQRMFLTGSHKTKIKLWQFLIIYPRFLLSACHLQKYRQIVLRCLSSTSQNNLQQIKHYCQIFMMKLIYLNPNSSILEQACTILTNQLLTIQGQSSLLKNVGYMMIAGLILQLFYHKDLYSVLFSSVCSHIAYYRGLSQYFCYQMIDNAITNQLTDVKYMIILHKQFLKDEDSLKLTTKLQGIVEGYKSLIKNWNIQQYLLKQKPTLNGQVVSENHYIDKLKYLGHELIKQHKHEDGFMPYKQIWKKIVNQTLEFKQEKQEIKETQNSFQRKIDPSLDELYNFQPIQNKQKNINQLKILVVSAEKIAFYGHMARVGQILGISQLCIPHKTIIDMEDFYNVSVTAEKWLNITEHGFERVKKQKQAKKQKVTKKIDKNAKPLNKVNKKNEDQKLKIQEQDYQQIGKQNILKKIMKFKTEGYTLYLVKKSAADLSLDISKLDINKKSLLIIDELNLLNIQLQELADCFVSFNSYFSYHVEATIFIWEYFKKYSILK